MVSTASSVNAEPAPVSAAWAGWRIRVMRLLVIYAGLLLVMFGLVFAANLVPNRLIHPHVMASMPAENRSNSPFGRVLLDQWTECTATTIGMTGPAARMDALARTIMAPTFWRCDVAKPRLAAGEHVRDYWWYWHGYQIVMRPVLAIGDMFTARIVNFLLLATALFFFLRAVGRRFGSTRCAIVLLALLSAPIYTLLVSLTHGLVWTLGLGAAAVMVHLAERRRETLERFGPEMVFAIGMATSYLDFLTTPLVTLTLPLVALFWLRALPPPLVGRGSFASAVSLSAVWALGYAACWAAKAAIAVAYAGTGLIQVFIDRVFLRLGADVTWLPDPRATVYASISRNLDYNLTGLLIVAAAIVLRLAHIRRRPLALPRALDHWAAFAWIAMLPVLWWIVLRNHSIEHDWFVAPILIPSIALILAMVWDEPARGAATTG